MKDELYLKKIRAEFEYLKVEEQYQKKIFDKAIDEFDEYFGEKINTSKPNTTKQEKKWKQKKNKIKSVDKLYKKLAQKIHPDKKGGSNEDFQKLQEVIEDSNIEEVLELADDYGVDVSEEIEESDFYITMIDTLNSKIKYYQQSLVMQWYTVDKGQKDVLKDYIMSTFAK
jgi:hypothetical protein